MPSDILRLLQQRDSYISGAEMSSILRITRAAVWKKITILRRKGFIIEAVPSKGYRLVTSPDLSQDDIAVNACGSLWKKILFYPSVDSTNELAMNLSLKDGIESGAVIIADKQEKGRGRLGRQWNSPPGVNVYMSLVLYPRIKPRDAAVLTMLAAVSTAKALEKETGQSVLLKWPNDLLISGRKVGGILTEVRADPDKIKVAVIGIGINVNMDKKTFPSEIRGIATSLKAETGIDYSRSSLIIRILREFETCHENFEKNGKKPVLEEMKTRSATLGKRITLTVDREICTGVAEEIDDLGVLHLRMDSGDKRLFSTGDITCVR
jgi:BirA family biotin operon repressor/biotin-[acetyl-CoA-carboxylase] ligase